MSGSAAAPRIWTVPAMSTSLVQATARVVRGEVHAAVEEPHPAGRIGERDRPVIGDRHRPLGLAPLRIDEFDRQLVQVCRRRPGRTAGPRNGRVLIHSPTRSPPGPAASISPSWVASWLAGNVRTGRRRAGRGQIPAQQPGRSLAVDVVAGAAGDDAVVGVAGQLRAQLAPPTVGQHRPAELAVPSCRCSDVAPAVDHRVPGVARRQHPDRAGAGGRPLDDLAGGVAWPGLDRASRPPGRPGHPVRVDRLPEWAGLQDVAVATLVAQADPEYGLVPWLVACAETTTAPAALTPTTRTEYRSSKLPSGVGEGVQHGGPAGLPAHHLEAGTSVVTNAGPQPVAVGGGQRHRGLERSRAGW